MGSFEIAQWAVIAFLVWRVLALENSQLLKTDLDPIRENLRDIIRMIHQEPGQQ